MFSTKVGSTLSEFLQEYVFMWIEKTKMVHGLSYGGKRLLIYSAGLTHGPITNVTVTYGRTDEDNRTNPLAS